MILRDLVVPLFLFPLSGGFLCRLTSDLLDVAAPPTSMLLVL